MKRYWPFINGAYFAKDAAHLTLKNPALEQPFAEISLASKDTVDHAVLCAKQAYHSQKWHDPSTRFSVMLQIATSLKRHLPEMAELESIQTGRPIREMTVQLQRLPEWIEYFASLARTVSGYQPPFKGMLNIVQRVPLGVVAQITPWNHPLLIAIKKIAPALAAGNSIVLKPSELAPLNVLKFAELCSQAGLPDGILNVVCGYGSETGDALCSNKDIAKLDVTGGTETGRKIAAKAGENLIECIAELGGKAPVLVFKDANIQDAVNGAAFAAFIASGQTCVMGSRILVQDSVYDEFLEKFKLKIANITMGNPLDMKTMMGPVISQQSRIRIHAHVLHALSQGAKLQAGGYIPDMVGHYYPPTCLEVTPDMDVFHKEVFGPVVCITPFSTVSEAIKLANDSEFGLACSIWDQDFKNALSVSQQIDTGIVWINGHHHNDPSSPWGGVKNSGMGRENGQEAYLAYTSSKSIVMNYGPSSDWFGQSESRYG